MWWNMNDAIRMQISAFVDGELPENEAEMLLRRMSQDGELRQQVADFLTTGRLIRGERSIPGMERLRERIAADVDERPLPEETEVVGQAARRYVRPLGGVAIAATVALAAIFGLQQTLVTSDQPDAAAINDVADSIAPEVAYTVPDAPDPMLREYRLSHGATWLDLAAGSVNARLVSLQGQGWVEELDAEEELPDRSDDQAAGESTQSPDEQTL